ncbi:hemerythrin domain-containing protein [Actinoallomurus iriomotensis]|uniref:Hemerythrin n=1 Tax=Actinoallomurus iriomotensis TaxID=478107 RepID=A0A9W6SAN3_9ACTN|nr:hemerythrin domain-containing protein [Actinoallomurus iriomotensis]GLY91481.1 hemerythrin [Actinoallomurus iriomotensis]
MNPPEDLITVLTEDHRELNQLFTELEVLSGGESLRRSLADQMIIETVRHAVAEEAYFYPAVREYLPDGDLIADEACGEHEHVEQILKRLARTDMPDDHFSLQLSWLITDARRHMTDEEERIFPLLAAHVSRETLVSLGEKAKQAKASAPSRDTSGETQVPLLHTIVKSGIGLVERVRDHLCGPGRVYPLTSRDSE